jgi:hypothetical protein
MAGLLLVVCQEVLEVESGPTSLEAAEVAASSLSRCPLKNTLATLEDLVTVNATAALEVD